MANILLVDDMATIRRIVKAVLDGAGHVLDEAEDGLTAFRKLGDRKYDLVISDWNMPRGNGTDLVRAMKQTPAYASIPVVMLTAEAEKTRIQEMAALGVRGYVLKPFKPETLLKVVEKVLSA
jgi:two-component system chemotaxis response regulator CheY